MIETPIITSLLDQDLYTLTVGQVAFKSFSTSRTQYQFINRNHTDVPSCFIDELNHQLELMSNIQLTTPEFEWLKSLGYFHENYLNWLSDYRFDPSELIIKQVNKTLTIEICGDWMRSIMFEVPLLALVSELYFRLTNKEKCNDWQWRIINKAKILSESGCKWIDFGSRRRFSLEVQDEVVRIMANKPGFLGTSNMMLAHKYGVPPIGTMSHQGPMAMMAKYGIINANRKWMEHWKDCYGEKLLTYLVDTFTTEVFLRDFNKEDAIEWNLRQDSGNPYDWMEKILLHYNKLGLSTENKTFVFSDGLTAETYKQISMKYRSSSNIIGGIGTSLSNDCGHDPLNIVIKMISADFGKGMIPVVKLSDSLGKYTGNPDTIIKAKQELGLQ